MDLDFSSDPELQELAFLILAGLLEGLIAEGNVDPSGKDKAELLDEVAAWWKAHEDEVDILPLVSHEERILAEARRYVARGDREFSIMMFATWMEHRLNYLLMWGGKRRGLSAEEAIELIRSSNVSQKTGVLWKLTFAEDLAPDIVAGVRATAAQRNAFVHYKWRMKSDDQVNEAAELDRTIELAERAIKGLEGIYTTRVMRGFAG